jgi:hypothetical protein
MTLLQGISLVGRALLLLKLLILLVEWLLDDLNLF